MILGSPMVLYGKSLGATATVLGIIAGMMPLLVIFQIPAANHVARVGFKRFVYAGWGTRVAFIFGMAGVPLTGLFMNQGSQLALLLFLLFGFNLSRGISSCAWLPWITALVPENIRGRYLAREAVCVNGASLVALLVSGLMLGTDPAPWRFAAVFAFSAVMGAWSLRHLKAIPDVPQPEPSPRNPHPVPWAAIANHPPFRKLLRMNVAWAASFGGMNTFSVAFLRSEAGMADGRILILTGLSFLGGLAALWFFESRTDQYGSKPVVTLSLVAWMAISLTWALLAMGGMSTTTLMVVLLQIAMGTAYALVNMNNTRLAMLLAPPMGRSHFFALFSVVFHLTLGVAPIVWGLVIDAIGTHRWVLGSLELGRFGVFFLLVTACFGWALWLCRRLDEPKARSLDELLRDVLQSPLRFWVRLWPRN